MNLKRLPASFFQFGNLLPNISVGRLNGNEKIYSCCLFFCSFFFLTPLFSYSQTNKDSQPAFIIQGIVKLKNKPVDGVSLKLSKEGKSISQILTRKNGLYSFQMDKSIINKESEYILDVIKEGTVSGILRINTFTTKEELNSIPDLFYLEINLNISATSDIAAKHDFGKIKWDQERGVFDFDKEYVSTVEKDNVELKTDSIKPPLVISDKIINVDADTMKTHDVETQIKTDSIPIQQFAKEESIHQLIETKAPASINGTIVSVIKEKDVTGKKELEKDTLKFTKTDAKSEEPNLKSEDSNITPKSEKAKKNPNEIAKLNTKENGNNISNLKEASQIKAVDFPKQKKEISENKKDLIVKKNQNISSKPVPLKNKDRQITNFQSIDTNPESFDGASIFSLNSEKNMLLEISKKMERKKSENLAKKYETSNTLTSLMDVVEEYDKK